MSKSKYIRGHLTLENKHIMKINVFECPAIGYMGRMLAGSKRTPEGEVIVWNGNIFQDREGTLEKIWYGDIRLTDSEVVKSLKKYSTETGYKLYVLREMDGRFEYEREPDISRPVLIVEGSILTSKDEILREKFID